MKKIFAVLALSALALTGCGSGNQAPVTPAEAVSPSSIQTTTPTPTPTVMTASEAGTFYLGAVCPSNMLSDKLAAEMQAQPISVAQARKAAGALRDSYRKTIETLSDRDVNWPSSVKTDVATLADSMYGDLSGAANVATQTTEANLISAWNSWVDEPNRAPTAQKIRVKLGLSSDTAGSCKAK